MYDPELDHPAILDSLAPLLGQWSEQCVPAMVEPLPHNAYTPEYEWMYAFEKGFKRRIEETLGRRLSRTWDEALFGADGVISEGLSNAYVHAHRRDRRRAIEVRAAVSRKGLGVEIRDQGKGFDHRALVERAARGEGGFFHNAGNGLRSLLERPGVRFSYGEGGRVLYLLAELGIRIRS